MRTKLGAAQITIAHYADEPGWDVTGVVLAVLHFGEVPLDAEMFNDSMDVAGRIAEFVGRYPNVKAVDLAGVAFSHGMEEYALFPIIPCQCDAEPDCKRCLGFGLKLPGSDALRFMPRTLCHPKLSLN